MDRGAWQATVHGVAKIQTQLSDLHTYSPTVRQRGRVPRGRPSCIVIMVALGVKTPPASAEDSGLILGLGSSPGGGNGNSLQYSCLINAMDRGAWWAIVHGVARVRHDLATKPPP